MGKNQQTSDINPKSNQYCSEAPVSAENPWSKLPPPVLVPSWALIGSSQRNKGERDTVVWEEIPLPPKASASYFLW